MGRFGKACDGCGGEDCACCEIYLEDRASQRYQEEPEEYFDDAEFDRSWEPVFDDNLTDAEADADTLASAGMGTNEDYGDFDSCLEDYGDLDNGMTE